MASNLQKIKFSICICNLNMSDTLEISIKSVMEQIDNQHEVIIVDDGSSDSSLQILSKLSEIYPSLRFYSLSKDRKRRLGATRNFSIQKAYGEWCLFHIDTDDYIGPNIIEFEKMVLALDSKVSKDLLYSGQQIHMARRNFLIENGPFKNIYRGEDRDLYQRLAFKDQWIVIQHKRFIERMVRVRKKYIKKLIIDAWDSAITDMQMRPKPFLYLSESLIRIKRIGGLRFVFRVLITPAALIAAKRRGIYDTSDRINNYKEFADYRESHSKSFTEWGREYNLDSKIINEIKSEIFY